MTVSSTTRKAGPYDGNDLTTAFPFDFKVFANTDVQVISTSAAGVETVKTLTTDYTVALNADQDSNPGGTVTMLVAPATGTTLTMLSQVSFQQPDDITDGGAFYPGVVESGLDRAIILAQQLLETVGRSIKIPASYAGGANLQLPTPVANKILGWDSSGLNLKNFDLSTSGEAKNILANDGASETLWSTVQEFIDSSTINLTDYAAMRTYTGPAKNFRITGLLGTAQPQGIVGVFSDDDTDTTSGAVITGSISGNTLSVTSVVSGAVAIGLAVNRSDTGETVGYVTAGSGASWTISGAGATIGPSTFTLDNNGTLIVSPNGRRRKRQYDGNLQADWFVADRYGINDSLYSIISAFKTGNVVECSSGSYFVSASIALNTGYQLLGKGRGDGGTSLSTGASSLFNLFSPAANARRITVKGFQLSSPAGGTNSCFGVDPAGMAESTFEDLIVSGFKYWIYATESYWQNTHRDIRTSCPNAIYIYGNSGTSLNNLFDNVYVDHSGTSACLAVQFRAVSTTTFLKCNFGGSPVQGQFVDTSSSCYGINFVNCNFEQQRVSAASYAFSHADNSKVVYDGCTFIDIDEISSSAYMIRGVGPSVTVDLRNCTIPNASSAITYYLYMQGATCTLDNSPDFDNPSKTLYAQNSDVYPPVVRSYSSNAQKIKSLTYTRNDVLTQDIVTQEIFTFYSSTGATHNLLQFTYGTPTASDDSTVIGGELIVSFAGRNDGGARTNGTAKFNIYFNNDGVTIITRSFMASSGARTVDIALAQSANIFTLTITPSAGNISGGKITAHLKYTKVKNASTDITVAFVS